MLSRRDLLAGVGLSGRSIIARAAGAAPAAAQPSTPVAFLVPPGACDSHTHVFGSQDRFPFAGNATYRHEPATADELRALHRWLRVDRVVLVQPTGYGTDNRCLLEGVRQLGARARAAVAVDDAVSDRELDEMHGAGARGIRLTPGRGEVARRLEAAGKRLAGRNWHINTSGSLSSLADLADVIAAMLVPVVFDHWALPDPLRGVNQPGFDVLLQLLKAGRIYVKLTHRIHALSTEGAAYDATPLARAMIAANPQCILWATDWPHAGIRPPGYAVTDISPFIQIDDGRVFNQLTKWASDPAEREAILVGNPARLYAF
jgi:predicted TIM-barrel fold metal-dependent hydrolase